MESAEKLTVEYVDPKCLFVFDYSRKLFPELQGEAYEFLKADIKENGIRTPLEVTKENLILCGHERHRVALDIGLLQVPVIRYCDVDVVNQKIRCIKDNLARKAVDTRTKVHCYGELRELYGLKREQLGKVLPRDEQGHMMPYQSSEGQGFMSHADMAKDVGMKESTLERSLKIEHSNLPEEIKVATFKGRLGIEPVANLIKEPEPIKNQVIPKLLTELKTEKEHIYVQEVVDEVKDELQSSPTQTMHEFLNEYRKAIEKLDCPDSTKEDIELIKNFFKKMLKDKNIICNICGETTLQWKCGHDF